MYCKILFASTDTNETNSPQGTYIKVARICCLKNLHNSFQCYRKIQWKVSIIFLFFVHFRSSFNKSSTRPTRFIDLVVVILVSKFSRWLSSFRKPFCWWSLGSLCWRTVEVNVPSQNSEGFEDSSL